MYEVAGQELADLGGTFFALMAVLAAAAVGFLIRNIARGVGDWGIGPFSVNVGGILAHFLGRIVNWCIGSAEPHFLTISRWIVAHFYNLDATFGATVSAVHHLGDQVAHLYNTSVPNALDAAIGYATRMRNEAESYVDQQVGDAERDASTALSSADRDLKNLLGNDVGTLENAISNAITNAVNQAHTYTDETAANLRGWAGQHISDAVNMLEGDLGTVSRQLGQAISSVAQTAATNLTDAVRTVNGEITQAAATAASEVAGAEQAAQAEAQQVASTAASEVAAASAQAAAQARAVAAASAAALTSTAGALAGDIAGQAQAEAGDLSQVKNLLEGAIAAAVGAVAIRVSKLESCAVTTCDGPNNLTGLLNTLMGAASFATVFEFLKAAEQHPGQVAAELSGEAQDIWTGANQLLDSLLSL